MTQSYIETLRVDARKDPEGWGKRSRGAARRVLSAVCFRETAESTFQKTGSALLPTVGFYYALFHMGIAALYLEHRTRPAELRMMRHGRLHKLLDLRLLQTGNLAQSYLDLLKRLQVAREYSNYVLGGKMLDDADLPISRHDAQDLYGQTGAEFVHVIDFIRAVSTQLDGILCPLDGIAVTIGDDIGDDVYQIYLSPDDEERVTEYLVERRLTT
mgnify:CR=1 FL=1